MESHDYSSKQQRRMPHSDTQEQQHVLQQDRTSSTRVMPPLQQAPASKPRRAQSMPNKIPISVVGEDYDWRDIPLSPNRQEIPFPPHVFSLPSSISLYQDDDLPRAPKTSKRNLTRNIYTVHSHPSTTYPSSVQQSEGINVLVHHHDVSFSSSSSSSCSSSNDGESTSQKGDSTSNDSSKDEEVISEEDSAPGEFSFNLAHLSLQQTYATTKRQDAARHSSAESSSLEASSPKRIKHDQTPMLCAMHEHQKFLHEKKQRRDDRKRERDVAMAAAMYYGECYIEGIGMSDAEKAARDSHEWYKKWHLQDVHANGNMVASLGDGYRVPVFATIPGTMAQSRKVPSEKATENLSTGVEDVKREEPSLGETLSTNDNKEENAKQREQDGAFLTVESTGEEKQYISEATAISCKVDLDRTSGAQNPPLSQNCVIGKKRQRNSCTIPYCSRNSDCGRESACSSTDETIPFSNLHESHKEEERDNPHEYPNQPSVSTRSITSKQPATFESFRDERMERERRFSSYSDYYDDGFHPVPLNRQPSEKVSSNRDDQHTLEVKCHDEEKYNAILTSVGSPLERTAKHIDNAKLDLIRSLSISGGNVTSQTFLFALEQLRTLYAMTENDARYVSSPEKRLEGTWLTISRPHYAESLGTNTDGEYMYSLGRMSFDMFAPGNLICSIHGIFNSIDIVQAENICFKSIPASLKDEVMKGDTILRKYK